MKKDEDNDFLKKATPKDLAIIDYMKKHNYIGNYDLPIKLSIKEFDEYVKILYNEKSTIEEKEKAIIILAHIKDKDNAIQVFNDLQKYNVIKDERLKIWIEVALSELKDDISVANSDGDIKFITIKVPESLKEHPEEFLNFIKKKAKEKKKKNNDKNNMR